MGGLSAPLPPSLSLAPGAIVRFEMLCNDRWLTYPVTFITQAGGMLRLRFEDMSLARRRELVSAIMGRADAWQPAGKPPSVNPLAALASLITASLSLF
ncbi:MAG TPA: hypothetical protein PKB04_10070, partial [Phenylobacterium sp.]|nr:hypothetical protein [Phenylobacterium sp.]